MRSRLLPLAFVAALAGCGDDPAAPRPLNGSWVLHSIAGNAVPVLIRQDRMVHVSGVAGTRREWIEGMRLAIEPSMADTVFVLRRVEWELDTGEDPAPQFVAEEIASPDLVRADTLCFHVGMVPEFFATCPDPQALERVGSRLHVQSRPGPYPDGGHVRYEFVNPGP